MVVAIFSIGQDTVIVIVMIIGTIIIIGTMVRIVI